MQELLTAELRSSERLLWFERPTPTWFDTRFRVSVRRHWEFYFLCAAAIGFEIVANARFIANGQWRLLGGVISLVFAAFPILAVYNLSATVLQSWNVQRRTVYGLTNDRLITGVLADSRTLDVKSIAIDDIAAIGLKEFSDQTGHVTVLRRSRETEAPISDDPEYDHEAAQMDVLEGFFRIPNPQGVHAILRSLVETEWAASAVNGAADARESTLTGS